MKYVRLIDIATDRCQKVCPVARLPENREAAKALFAELLMDNERYRTLGPKYNWLTGYSRETGWTFAPTLFLYELRGWRLEFVERKKTIIDATNEGQAPKYTYFVTYQHHKTPCSANCEVYLNKPIESIEDVQKIEAHISTSVHSENSPCTVTNFILLNTHQKQEGKK